MIGKNNLTITELATILNSSRQTIYNHIKKLGIVNTKKNKKGIIQISPEQQIQLYESITGNVYQEESILDDREFILYQKIIHNLENEIQKQDKLIKEQNLYIKKLLLLSKKQEIYQLSLLNQIKERLDSRKIL